MNLIQRHIGMRTIYEEGEVSQAWIKHSSKDRQKKMKISIENVFSRTRLNTCLGNWDLKCEL